MKRLIAFLVVLAIASMYLGLAAAACGLLPYDPGFC